MFPGSEVFLLDGLRKGGAGCITASGNVNVPGIRKVYENWQEPQADALQAEITTLRKAFQAYPMVPALKRIVAHFHNDPDWAAVRPPMTALTEAQSAALLADLAKLGFTLGERRGGRRVADARRWPPKRSGPHRRARRPSTTRSRRPISRRSGSSCTRSSRPSRAPRACRHCGAMRRSGPI